MSLSSLNSPPLVAIAGTAVMAGLPQFEKIVSEGGISWNLLKVFNAVSYIVNTLAVSVPGRIDGQEAAALVEEQEGRKATRSEEAEAISTKKGRSLVTPSGWAFAIWGPIFAGELVFIVSQLLVPESAEIAPVIKQLSPAFIVAQTVQSLWCASFRPKYKGNLMYISSAMLAGAAFSLSKAHSVFTSSSVPYSTLQYVLNFLPMSLHFGWLTAAAFVNLNGAIAMKKTATSKVVAFVGHASVVAATAAGVLITIKRSAPVFGGVISWALFAVADGMKKRLETAKPKKDDDAIDNTYGALTQKRLGTIGALVSLGASIVSVIFKDKKAGIRVAP